MKTESNSRTHKAATNIAYSIANRIIIIVLNFLLRTLFIKEFGVGLLGLNGLFSNVLSVLSMADLGLNTAMIFSFYEPLANKNYETVAALTGFYKKIYNVIAITITILGICIIPVLPKLVNLDSEIPLLNVYYLFALSNVVFSYLFVYKTSVLVADQNNYVVVRISTLVTIFKSIAQIIILVTIKSYIAYLVIDTIAAFLTNFISSKAAIKKYPFITEQSYDLGDSEKKNIVNIIISAFVFKISNVLMNATDNIIISVMIGTIMVGLYSNYLLVQNQIVAIFRLIFTSATASIGNLIVSERPERRLEIFQSEQTLSFILSCIIVPCFFGLINPFITIWLGTEYTLNLITVTSISLYLFLSCTMQPLWTYREATGLYKKTKYIMIICAIENIFLSVILGKLIGVAGVIFASSISRLTTYIWYEPKLLFNTYFELAPKTYYIDLLINSVIVIVLCMIVGLINYLLPIEGVLNWLLHGFLLTAICVAVAYIVYHNSPGYIMLLNKAKSLLKRSDK